MFRVIGDTIEYDSLPIATILPSVWPTRRDYIEQSLENYSPDKETDLKADRDKHKYRADQAEAENKRLTELVNDLECENTDLCRELERGG